MLALIDQQIQFSKGEEETSLKKSLKASICPSNQMPNINATY